MQTKLQKWGNSQGIRISKTILEECQLHIGELIEISAQAGKIIIKPVSKVRGKYNLQKLIDEMPKTSKPQELNRGKPLGKEEW